MKIQFKVGLAGAILAIIFLLSATTLASLWLVGKNAAQEAAGNLFTAVSENTESKIADLIDSSLGFTQVLSGLPDFKTEQGDGLSKEILPLFFQVLEEINNSYSIYIALDDGSFYQLIAARAQKSVTQRHEAPPNTYWIVRNLYHSETEGNIESWSFLDEAGQKLAGRRDLSPEYDPRVRPWYLKAQETNGSNISEVYIFHSLKEPGITASQKMKSVDGVIGIDLTLSAIEGFIGQQQISQNGDILVYDQSNRLIAFSAPHMDQKQLSDVSGLADEKIQHILQVDRDGRYNEVCIVGDYFVLLDELFVDGPGFKVAISAPISDFQESFSTLQKQVLIIMIVSLFLFVPLSVAISNRLGKRIVSLSDDARRISRFDFHKEARAPSWIVEFIALEDSFDTMRISLDENATALKHSQEKLNRLVEFGIAMAGERDTDKLMEMLLLGAKELSNADGGTLYKIEEGALSFKLVQNTTLKIAMGGTSGVDPTIPPVPLYDAAGDENHANVVSHCVHESMTVNIPDAYNNDDFDFTGTRKFDEMNGYRSKSFLTVPLKPRGGDVIGALQILNAQDKDGNIITFDEETQPYIEALAAQAATIIYNNDLLEAQENLMDAMIQLLAGAIDAKSPYTGGHCLRVPELAEMLARKASQSKEGVFKDFTFETEEQWREFKIGAWLHDCGKVVTPEYVVDKATKLETIYNRIHEVRTRFEVLLREADIAYYKGLLAGEDEDSLKQKLEEERSQLFDDFAFVAECNVGGEFMEDEKIERLEKIAKRTWMRHFDMTLGLSHEEAERFEDTPSPPALEKLLDDKPYHIIERGQDVQELYKTLKFTTPIPKHLYNRGEVYNLRVKRGTLSEEERFKIQEHIMQTLVMLENMPFPPHLKRVPEYAGTHHETMDGTGYPRSLSAEELSIPARIMAVADIFEALTASDRPYKKAKTLSEAVKILSFFKKDGHIDPEVFDLFLTSGVYLDYAEIFLLPEQIDQVDISKYLN